MADSFNKKDVDVSGYDVIIDKPIWLGSKIWEPKLYENPPKVLLECAREQFGREDAVVHFMKNGRRVNPFSKAVIVDVDIPDETPDDTDEVEEDVSDDGDTDSTVDVEFMSPADFASLGKSEQHDYIEEIRNAPDDYDDDAVAEYEENLKPVLEEYLKVVSGVKAKEAIEEVLAEYEE